MPDHPPAMPAPAGASAGASGLTGTAPVSAPTGAAAEPGSLPVRPLAALGLLSLVILLWGANWPVMKVGLTGIEPFTFVAIRLVFGAAVLFAVAAALGQLRFPARADWPVVIGVGVFQMALFLGLVTWALQIVPAGRSAILSYTTPLWVVPLAMLVLGERLSRLKGVGLVLGLGGIAVLFNPAGLDWGDGQLLLGNGMLMLAALAWAIGIVQVRAHRWRGTPLSLGPWQLVVGALPMAVLAFALETPTGIAWTPEIAAAVIYNGPIATAFCYWAMVTVTRALPAITTALATLGTPVVGLLLATWLLGEPLTITNVAGLCLIGGGLALVALADRRR